MPLKGEYYLHKRNIYKIIYTSRGTDEIMVERLDNGKKQTVVFAAFKHAFKRVWKVGDVAEIIGRSPRSIYRYERAGQIQKPVRYPDRFGRELRFYTKEEILDLLDSVSHIHQGRPRPDRRVVNNTLRSKAEVLETFRNRFEE